MVLLLLWFYMTGPAHALPSRGSAWARRTVVKLGLDLFRLLRGDQLRCCLQRCGRRVVGTGQGLVQGQEAVRFREDLDTPVSPPSGVGGRWHKSATFTGQHEKIEARGPAATAESGRRTYESTNPKERTETGGLTPTGVEPAATLLAGTQRRPLSFETDMHFERSCYYFRAKVS